MSLEIYLSTHVTALLDLLARFLVQTSLLCRGVVGGGGGGEGRGKGGSKCAWHDGKRKERKRGLCHITCGSLEDLRVCELAKRGDYLDDFEGCCEDNIVKG